MKKILSLDLGTTTGWAFVAGQTDIITGSFTHKTYHPWAKELSELIKLYNPQIIICSQTNNFGFFNANRKAHMLFGIACLLGETAKIPVIEFNDSSARKALFGKGGMDKKTTHQLFDSKFPEHSASTPDEKDALVLTLGWIALQQ